MVWGNGDGVDCFENGGVIVWRGVRGGRGVGDRYEGDLISR